jgi:hypothetical protein
MPIRDWDITDTETGVTETLAIDIPKLFTQTPEMEEDYIHNVFLPVDYKREEVPVDMEPPPPDDTPLSFLPDPLERGLYGFAQSFNIWQDTIGLDPETNAKDIADYQRHIDNIPADKSTRDILKRTTELEASWEGVKDFWDLYATGDGLQAIGTVALESLGRYAPVLAAALVGGKYILGGRAMQLVAGALTGLGTVAEEYGASVIHAMDEHLRKKGVGEGIQNADAVQELLSNEDKMAEFREFGVKRGIPIGLFAGLSMGLAGRFTAAVMKSTGATIPRIAGAAASEALGMQPILGATGEHLAQKFSGEPYKLGEVLLEGVAEGPIGAIETGIGTYINTADLRAKRAGKGTDVNDPNTEEVSAMGRATARLKYLDSIDKEDEVATVRQELAAGPENAAPFVERLKAWINPSEIKVGNWLDKTLLDKVFGFRNKKSKNAVMQYLVKEGYLEKKKGSTNLFDWTAKAESEFNLDVIGKQLEEESTRQLYVEGNKKRENNVRLKQLEKEKQTAPKNSQARIDREIAELTQKNIEIEEGMVNLRAVKLRNAEWVTDATNERQLLPSNIAPMEAKQAGFIVSYLNSKQAEAIAQDPNQNPEGLTAEELIGRPTYRIGNNTFQNYLASTLNAKQKAELAEKSPFILPNRIRTDLNSVVDKAAMPTDRTGKPWDSAQAIADEYVELQETQRFLEEQQATEDAQQQPNDEKKEEALKNISNRLKRMETIFRSGIWKRTAKENNVTFDTPYFNETDEEVKQNRMDNIESKFVLKDPTYTTLPEKVKDVGDVLLDTEDQAFVNANKIELTDDPDTAEHRVQTILLAQQVDQDLSPEQPGSQEVGDGELTQDAYLEDIDSPLGFDMIDEKAMSPEDKQKWQEQREQYINKRSLVDLAKDAWRIGLKNSHPIRLASKFPPFMPFYRLVLARRARKMQLDFVGFAGTEPVFRDSTPEQIKTLSKAAMILDLFANPIAKVVNVQPTPDGGVEIIIPEKPPSRKDKEGNIVQDLPTADYKRILSYNNINPGTLKINADLWSKYNIARKSFNTMYDQVIKSYVRQMLQDTPLRGEPNIPLKEESGDTLVTFRDKLKLSVRNRLLDFNKVTDIDKQINIKDPIPEFGSGRETFINKVDKIIKPLRDEKGKLKKGGTDAEERILVEGGDIIEQLNMINVIDRAIDTRNNRPYYIPRQRYGSYMFTVHKKRKDGSNGQLVVLEKSTPQLTDTTMDGVSDRKERKRLEKRIETLKAEGLFPENEFKFSEVDKVKEAKDITDQYGIGHKDIEYFEELAQAFGFNIKNHSAVGVTEKGQKDKGKNNLESSDLNRFFDLMKRKARAGGFDKFLATRSPKNTVLGYYTPTTANTYLTFSLSNYIRTAADTASNLEYYKGMRTAVNRLNDQGLYNLSDAANNLIRNINNPKEAGSFFKAYAFHYAIGLNFSSAGVNLTQPWVATAPVMKSIIGLGKGNRVVAKELLKASRVAFKLMKDIRKKENRASFGFSFDEVKITEKAKKAGLNQEEWSMLRDLYQKGVIQAIMNIDLGATYQATLGEIQDVVKPEVANMAADLATTSATMFAAVEQINRITTALATYRLAKKKGNLKKFAKYADINTTYKMDAADFTPSKAAEMMTYETQFLISKENRPEVFHNGLMNVATQFMSFQLQYISLWAKAFRNFGVDPKMSATLLAGFFLTMMFWGGFMGIPFGENLRQLIKIISNEVWKDGEIDIEIEARRIMADLGMPGWATDSMMHGWFKGITGIDLHKRVGVGEIIPTDLIMGDLAVAGGPTFGLTVDAAKRMYNSSPAGLDPNWATFITSLLPLGIRNATDAARREIIEDTPVRTSQGRVLIPGEQLSSWENLKAGVGFTPTTISQARMVDAYAKHMQSEMKGVQDRYLSRLAKSIAKANQYYSKGDMKSYRDTQEDIADLYDEIRELNREAMEEGRPDKIVNVLADTLRDRVSIELRGKVDPAVLQKRIRKAARPLVTPAVQERLGLISKR